MFPANSAASIAVKPAQPVTTQTALRVSQPQAPETARSSAGEAAASSIRTETASAVQAAEQSAVAPRLRDQENAERSRRLVQPEDAPTGPPPAFEESPLERQARVAFDPPDLPAVPVDASRSEVVEAGDAPEDQTAGDAADSAAASPANPPPTPTERAEASFAETRTLSTPKEPATMNLAR